MISGPELRSVVDDIKRVAEGDYDNTSDEAGSDSTQNTFGGRAYDIDRLHADDARDKVFVAILKALVARHNRPSSPKELATCIMKHEFTMLGGATPYATVSSRISQHFKRIFDHHPPRPPILGRVAHEKHVRKYFYYVASAEEQEDFNYKVRAGLIPTQPMPLVPPPSTSRKKTRCMVPAAAVELDHSPGIRRSLSRRAVSVDVSEQPAVQVGRSRRTSYDDGCGLEVVESNPYARKRYRSVRSAVEQAYPRRRRADEGAGKWRRTDGLDGIFDGSLAVAPARDDLAAVVTDLLMPGLDDSVVPLCLGDSNLIT
ncbi:hypothetical protein IWW57_005274, partial [Coemansia sp. S610]